MNGETGTICIKAQDHNDRRLATFVRPSSDVGADLNIMNKAVGFRYAADQHNKALIVALIPRWKAWVCEHVLRIK